MTGVFGLPIRRRFRFPRLAAVLALVAQLVAVGIGPAAEAFAFESAPAHVEDAGIHLHHSHNPADCPACTAIQLGASGLPSRPERTRPFVVENAPPLATRSLVVAGTRALAPHAPRPPPALRSASL